jgi:hypothetical protein
MEVCERLADSSMAIAPNKLKKVNEELKMKHIKPLFAAAFMLFINMAHAQTATTTAAPATVALAPSPTIAPAVDNPYGLAAVWGQGDWVADHHVSRKLVCVDQQTAGAKTYASHGKRC